MIIVYIKLTILTNDDIDNGYLFDNIQIMNHSNSRQSFEPQQIEAVQYELNESGQNHNAQDYSLQFQNRFKIYQLNSQVNQANLRLQKMALQYQNSMKEQRQYFIQLQSQKNMIVQKYEELEEEYNQLNMFLEVQKKQRENYQQNLKKANVVIKKIKQALGLNEEVADESTLIEIQNILDRWHQSNLIIQKLTDKDILMINNNIDGGKNRVNQYKIQKQQYLSPIQQGIKTAAIQQDQKYKELQKQLLYIQQALNQKQILVQKMSEKFNNLLKRQLQIDQLVKTLQQLQWQNTSKEEQLRSLRTKQENWLITRDKSREQKIKYDQQIQQLKFQLDLSGRKIQIVEGKLKQQQLRSKKLEQIIKQYKQKQIENEEKQMQHYQQYGDLKKKLHINQIYKDKFKQTQAKLKETEERLNQFNNMADQYSKQIHNLQIQTENLQDKIRELGQTQRQLSFQLELKQKQIIKIKMTVDHHQQVIKSNQSDIERYQKKIEHYEKNSDVSLRSNRIEQGETLRLQNQIVNQDIFKQYQSLLQSEDKHRSQLQKQFQQAQTSISQLKSQLNQLQRDYNQVKQEKQLLKDQNIRLIKNNSQIHRFQEKKINQIREKYRQIKIVNRETNEGSRKRMKIVNFFNLFQAEDIHSNGNIKKVFNQGNSEPTRQIILRRTQSSKFIKKQINFRNIEEANIPGEASPISIKTFKVQKASQKLIRPPQLDDEQIRFKQNIQGNTRFKKI